MLAPNKIQMIPRVLSALFIIWSFVFSANLTAAEKTHGVAYTNPRVYNVVHVFELVTNPQAIDRSRDLKLWIPIPREASSQKAIEIVSVSRPAGGAFEDLEHGNRMLFWDLGEGPRRSSYKVTLLYRLDSYEVQARVNPDDVFDKSTESETLIQYTRSSPTIGLSPKA